ncbi:DNA repair protein RecN [Flavobacterium sp.]|uniref:DNA repair protein RecN n=5 Tax=Flavobacterium sp. TaxID=239 RepID=UPI004048533D
MLLSLSIKNYALIESLETDFSNQFSVITGETGAGKSILLGALGLVLGNRADLTSLKDKEQKCIIEAQFSISNYNLQSFFEENDMDYEDKTIIRREILPSGKSRAFVNDSPVNLQELQELGAMLLDIHSQHQTRELTEENYQIDILDAVANNGSLVISYINALSDFKSTQKELKQLISEKEALVKEYEYNSYLLNELLAANLVNGEQEDLEQELEQLSNVEFIKENLERISAIANEEQVGALMNLKEIKILLQKIATFSNLYSQLQERLTSSLLEIEDIISECEQSNEKILADPERLEFVTTKLQSIYNLQKKHQVQTVSELLLIQDELDAKVIRVDDLDGAIHKLESELNKQQIQVDEIAKLVSENRKKTAPILIEKIRTILSQLGMVEANFQIEINHNNSYYPKGKDEVVLLFSANKGTSFGLLKKVASGGEMSRIMLAIKAILANYSKLPTIIFDEIDTGVSGEIAIKMGEIMKEMSKTMQVFAITHLPQIAAKGSSHYKVSKRNQGETTISELNLLTAEERIQQIAEMLSGKEITESALQHAKALLN